MMREVKFRRWIKTDANKWEMEYDFYCIGDCDGELNINEELAGDGETFYMQFTGLKDKNGRKIYEGDIIQYFQFSQICSKCAHRDKIVNEVKFNSLGATLSSFRIIDPQSNISEIEIIGNIHQNSGLLENK